MGNRRSGRRPTPTAIKRLKGSRIRHDVAAEPSAPPGLPLCPPHVVADAASREAWDQLAARLLTQRVLTTAHTEALALLADGWAQYVRLQLAFAADGFRSVVKQEWTTEDGQQRSRLIENPLCRQIRQQATLLNTLFGEFGQTPASAPKVVAPGESVDPFDRFLSGGPSAVVPFKKARRA